MLLRILIVICLLFPICLFATHNRAGEITFKQKDDLTIEVYVSTYTKISSVQADRDSIEVNWGDGTSSFIMRINGKGSAMGNNTKFNSYVGVHTYPGRSTYTISVSDPNRVSQIQNINNTNSENIPFYIETTFTFTNQSFDGPNNSVVLLQPPIDIACTGKVFKHLPNAFDVDNDSIAFELIAPMVGKDLPVPNYVKPDQIIAGLDNTFSFNESTGEIIWDSPQKGGEYNITFLVKEYRNGTLITSIIRDMQIFVLDCQNNPPKISTEDVLCVMAGDTVSFPVIVDDPDQGQQVRLTGTGAPFSFLGKNKAVLNGPTDFNQVPFTSNFEWITNCNNVSNQYYQVVFRAIDNFINSNTGLADLKSTRIKVVAPAPEDLQGGHQSNSIKIDWVAPYACSETNAGYFRGFSIWRSKQTIDLPTDTCSNGISNTGYVRISNPVTYQENNRYFYIDSTAEKGLTYCYRVIAEFAKLTDLGYPYNIVESLPSEEICITMLRDIPLITKVDITASSTTEGVIQIDILKPDPNDLDTTIFAGPYTYTLENKQGNNYLPMPGATQTESTFSAHIPMLSFSLTNVNTLGPLNEYRVSFKANQSAEIYGYAPPNTDLRLDVKSSDQTIYLDWKDQPSWIDTLFVIYRKSGNLPFERIDSTKQYSYIDKALENEKEYCYFILGKSAYFNLFLENGIQNRSNEICGIPKDDLAPCAPTVKVKNPCDEVSDFTEEDALANTISWKDIRQYCSNASDIAAYRIYSIKNMDTIQLGEVDPETFEFIHKPKNGLQSCYIVTAIDLAGNESTFEEKTCVEDCPVYELPNVFTPNGDQENDVLIPRIKRFISAVDFKLYNAWGNLIFETKDPNIEWDGRNKNGKYMHDGTYYYTCVVYRTNELGKAIIFAQKSGFIELLKSR